MSGVFVMNIKALGKKIQKCRLEKGVTAEKMAEDIEMSTSMIREIERGNKLPSLPTFVKIANYLNVSADELLCDSIDCGIHISDKEIKNEFEGLSADNVSMIKTVVSAMVKQIKGKR